jgi:hypothetical protein
MRKLAAHKARHEITVEYLLAGALRGRVLDGSGRELLNLWTEFGVTQETVTIQTANDLLKIKKLFRDIRRMHEDNLDSDTVTGAELKCSRELFDAIVDHPVINKAYINNNFAPAHIAEDLRKNGFVIEGVKITEYSAKAADVSGTMRAFIPTGEGVCYPTGTSDTFHIYHAPSDFNEDVGSYGQQYYAKIMEGDFNRGWNIHSQFNSLPVCLRPKTLIKVVSA